MNLYITKSSVQGMIFFSTVIVRSLEKNLNIMKPRYSLIKFCSPLATSFPGLSPTRPYRVMGRREHWEGGWVPP